MEPPDRCRRFETPLHWASMKTTFARSPLSRQLPAVAMAVLAVAALHAAAAEPAAPAAPGPAPAAVAPAPAELSLEQAVLRVLAHNPALRVERLNPDAQRTYEETERSVFDPVFTGTVSRGRIRNEAQNPPYKPANQSDADTTAAKLALEEKLPTGTLLSLEGSATEALLNDSRSAATRLGLTVSQSLLRGFGTGANLARLRQAKLDTRISEYEFRGYLEALVQDTEAAYWDLALQERRTAIYQASLTLAEQQLDQTRKRIEAGTTAPSELPAAEAEVAGRRSDLTTAEAARDTARLTLCRLITPAAGGPGWDDRPLRLTGDPADLPAFDLAAAPAAQVEAALQMRPEMNQARLQISRGDLEIVRTRNGLLPKLDAFAYLGPTAYANTMKGTADEFDSRHYDAGIGLAFSYAFGSRAEKADLQRARIRRDQAGEALANLALLVEYDVRAGLVEIRRTRDLIASTEAVLRLRREALRVETEKFNNGRSTSILVAQAQRDLLAGAVAEIEAKIGFRNAVTRFYRLQGKLLERRGLDAPGREPVPAPDRAAAVAP